MFEAIDHDPPFPGMRSSLADSASERLSRCAIQNSHAKRPVTLPGNVQNPEGRPETLDPDERIRSAGSRGIALSVEPADKNVASDHQGRSANGPRVNSGGRAAGCGTKGRSRTVIRFRTAQHRHPPRRREHRPGVHRGPRSMRRPAARQHRRTVSPVRATQPRPDRPWPWSGLQSMGGRIERGASIRRTWLVRDASLRSSCHVMQHRQSPTRSHVPWRCPRTDKRPFGRAVEGTKDCAETPGECRVRRADVRRHHICESLRSPPVVAHSCLLRL